MSLQPTMTISSWNFQLFEGVAVSVCDFGILYCRVKYFEAHFQRMLCKGSIWEDANIIFKIPFDWRKSKNPWLEKAQNCLSNNFQHWLCCLRNTILMHPQDMLYQESIEKRLLVVSYYRQIILKLSIVHPKKEWFIIEIFLQLKPYNI